MNNLIKKLLKNDEKLRIDTFVDWPHGYPLTPELLARHGFYFCGGSDDNDDDYKWRDNVRCAGCSLEFCNFEPNTFLNRTHERTNCVFSGVRTLEYEFYNGLLTTQSTFDSFNKNDDYNHNSNNNFNNDKKNIVTVQEHHHRHNTNLVLDDDDNNDNNNNNENQLCCVCLEGTRNVCLSPCGHLVCEFCVVKLDTCPYCRQPIVMHIRIYI
ncbi:IAP-1 [Artaxa digramma nucleopolyhedrovirus]|uniref:IAP-1 n=1 Tax=Artaxa digramma nucleopolyhedrovirus TaxID=3070910 RepID=A0AAE6UZK5_9ABAC|nr:IAP-1 [Euproctis digramma nucleopolyhedrovirus]QHB21685.1 IAP-1 [Artaxa digramma nucleopolyhedrovirus]